MPHFPYFLSRDWQSVPGKRSQSRSQQRTPKSTWHSPAKHPWPTSQSQAVAHFFEASLDASTDAPADPPFAVPADPALDVPPDPVVPAVAVPPAPVAVAPPLPDVAAPPPEPGPPPVVSSLLHA